MRRRTGHRPHSIRARLPRILPQPSSKYSSSAAALACPRTFPMAHNFDSSHRRSSPSPQCRETARRSE
eukprot:4526954-Pyramimonas_sp.AAC.1